MPGVFPTIKAYRRSGSGAISVVIPMKIRRQLNIHEGAEFKPIATKNGILFKIVKRSEFSKDHLFKELGSK